MGQREEQLDYQNYTKFFDDDQGRRPRLEREKFLEFDEELLDLITRGNLRPLSPQEKDRETLHFYLLQSAGTKYENLSPAAREEVKLLKLRRAKPLSPLPPRQAQALCFIRDHIRLHGYSPSEAEIATYLSVTPPAVHDLILRLERSGRLVRTPGQARSLAIADPEGGSLSGRHMGSCSWHFGTARSKTFTRGGRAPNAPTSRALRGSPTRR